MNTTAFSFTFLVASAVGLAASPVELHVAPHGDDSAAGSVDAPFATLQRARDEIRRRKPQDGATVWLAAGEYLLPGIFRLGQEDSGRDGAPIVYAARPGEQVVLTGARPVDGFKRWKDGILVADAPSLALSVEPPEPTDAEFTGDFGPEDDRSPRFSSAPHIAALFLDRERQELARWPNRDPKSERWHQWGYMGGDTHKYPWSRSRSLLPFQSDLAARVGSWTSPELAEVFVVFWPGFFGQMTPVKAVHAEQQTLEVAYEVKYPFQPGRRFYVRNVLEELDAPGEWYWDQQEHKVYFYPPRPFEDSDVSIAVLSNLLVINGVSHVEFRGIDFEASNRAAIVARDCRNVRLTGCTIRNTGEHAIVFRNAADCSIRSCDVAHVASGDAVILDGGDSKTLEPGRNEISNCHIHHIGEVCPLNFHAINLVGVGNRCANNLLHDITDYAIALQGNDMLVEYNEIHHVCTQANDSGAIHGVGKWARRGNVIRHNYIHDLTGWGELGDKPASRPNANKQTQWIGMGNHPDENGATWHCSHYLNWGVYLDNTYGGVTVEGNVFARIYPAAVNMAGGSYNICRNNIFYDCGLELELPKRGLKTDRYREELEPLNFTQPPYSDHYPYLPRIFVQVENAGGSAVGVKIVNNIFSSPAETYLFKEMVPRNTVFDGNLHTSPNTVYNISNMDIRTGEIASNVVWRGGPTVNVDARFYGETFEEGAVPVSSFDHWLARGHDHGSVCADPMLADPDAGDFTLALDSPALRLGFQPIPMERIGLHKDKFRKSLPVPDTRRAPRCPEIQKKIIELQPEWQSPSRPASARKPRETVALESIKKGLPVASNETVGMHATLVGVVLAKDGQTFTLQIEKAVPGKDNEFPDLDSLVGKSIRVPLTLNPSWKQRAAADLDSLHPGERVGARVIYSKYLKGPGLLEITDIPRP